MSDDAEGNYFENNDACRLLVAGGIVVVVVRKLWRIRGGMKDESIQFLDEGAGASMLCRWKSVCLMARPVSHA